MLKKIGNIFINLVLAFSVVLFLMSLYLTFKNSDNPEDSFLFGLKPLYVTTDSMEPHILKSSVIIAQKTNFSDVDVNDVILYQYDEKLITHRVIEKTEEGLRTKGDNNPIQDAYVLTEDNFKGEIIMTWNWVSYFLNYIKTPTGKLVIIISAVALVVLIIISVIISRSKKSKTNQNPSKTTKIIEPDMNKARFAISVEEANQTDYIYHLYNTIKEERCANEN